MAVAVVVAAEHMLAIAAAVAAGVEMLSRMEVAHRGEAAGIVVVELVETEIVVGTSVVDGGCLAALAPQCPCCSTPLPPSLLGTGLVTCSEKLVGWKRY